LKSFQNVYHLVYIGGGATATCPGLRHAHTLRAIAHKGFTFKSFTSLARRYAQKPLKLHKLLNTFKPWPPKYWQACKALKAYKGMTVFYKPFKASTC